MTLTKEITQKLLSDRRVVDEINRHLWFESEKVGHDIGFEKAREDWLKRFSRAWMEYHMPDELIIAKKNPTQVENKTASASKKRRAKSYL